MNETQLCAIEQSIRDEHHSELRWPHYVLLDLIAEIRRLRGEGCNLLQMDGTTTPLCNACLECAFLRGAKAMREAIAKDFDCVMPDCRGCAEADRAAYVRASLIPEDE